MSKALINNKIQARPSPIHGYGVFAVASIAASEIIEECPVLTIDNTLSTLDNYVFFWETASPRQAVLALGYGSLYNHSTKFNATATPNYEKNLLIVEATKPILAGEEVLIFYAKNWFSNRGMKEIKPKDERKETLFLLIKVILVIGMVILLQWILK